MVFFIGDQSEEKKSECLASVFEDQDVGSYKLRGLRLGRLISYASSSSAAPVRDHVKRQ